MFTFNNLPGLGTSTKTKEKKITRPGGRGTWHVAEEGKDSDWYPRSNSMPRMNLTTNKKYCCFPYLFYL